MAGHSSRPTGGRRGDAVTEDLPPGSSSPSEGPAGMGVARAMGGPLGVVDLDEGWSMLRDCAIHRLEHFLRTGEALGRRKDGKLCIFTRKEYSDLYTSVIQFAQKGRQSRRYWHTNCYAPSHAVYNLFLALLGGWPYRAMRGSLFNSSSSSFKSYLRVPEA